MTHLITNQARAYVNFGRWVADCPYECGGALQLTPGQNTFACMECRGFSVVEWPPDADDIWEALERRPAPRNRNWFPAGHFLAIRCGLPHGQSARDLDEETHENERS